MNTIGRAENRPASSSGSAGSSHAAASIAGTTVTAPNSHPGHRPGLFRGFFPAAGTDTVASSASVTGDPIGTRSKTHGPTLGPDPRRIRTPNLGTPIQ